MFGDLPGYLRGGDTLFRNNASVLPARLHGRRPTGGKVECLLLRKIGAAADGRETWQCLVRPGPPAPGRGDLRRWPTGTLPGEVAEPRRRRIRPRPLFRPGRRVGRGGRRTGSATSPCPPTSRAPTTPGASRTASATRPSMRTVRARSPSRRPPPACTSRRRSSRTSGDRGVRTADLTLHVGLGTFRPIATETVEAHPIHGEIYEIPDETQRALFPPLAGTPHRGRDDLRALDRGLPRRITGRPLGHAHVAEASLFIYPPRTFRGVDALVTNFHQPRSTLLCLVAAFLAPGSEDGIDWLMEIYAEAVPGRVPVLQLRGRHADPVKSLLRGCIFRISGSISIRSRPLYLTHETHLQNPHPRGRRLGARLRGLRRHRNLHHRPRPLLRRLHDPPHRQQGAGRLHEVQRDDHGRPDNLENSSVEATIDVGSVDTDNDKRNAHLKSPDFFDVGEVPDDHLQEQVLEEDRRRHV